MVLNSKMAFHALFLEERWMVDERLMNAASGLGAIHGLLRTELTTTDRGTCVGTY